MANRSYDPVLSWVGLPSEEGSCRGGAFIEDDSMTDPNSDDGFKPDEWVVYEERTYYHDGDVVAIGKDGTTIYRVFDRERGLWCLNPAHADMPLGDCIIKGIVIKRLRRVDHQTRDTREYIKGFNWGAR